MSAPARRNSKGGPAGGPGGAPGSPPIARGVTAPRGGVAPRGGGPAQGPGRAATMGPTATGPRAPAPVKGGSMPRQAAAPAARGGAPAGGHHAAAKPGSAAPVPAPKAGPGAPRVAQPAYLPRANPGPVQPKPAGPAGHHQAAPPAPRAPVVAAPPAPRASVALPAQPELLQSEQEEEWESENNSLGKLSAKFDKVAIAQRCLGIPIAEVVKNHHERLALLEEKVYGPGGEEEKNDIADQLNTTMDYSIQKKKRRGFFRRKKKVKHTPGEPEQVEYEEEFVEEDPGQDVISLEMMESQITREEVLRMFHAQSSTFKDLLREQRRCYDNALMNVMNELLAALEESEAGINGDRLNSLEERVALLELEIENLKAMQEAMQKPDKGFFSISRKGKEGDDETGSQSGSVFGIFGGGKPDKPASPPVEPVPEEESKGFFSSVFGGKKESHTPPPPAAVPPPRKGKKGVVEEAEYSEYSESGSEYSEYSGEQPQPDYYEMDEQPPIVEAAVVPKTERPGPGRRGGRRPEPAVAHHAPLHGARGGSKERAGGKGRDRSHSGGRGGRR